MKITLIPLINQHQFLIYLFVITLMQRIGQQRSSIKDTKNRIINLGRQTSVKKNSYDNNPSNNVYQFKTPVKTNEISSPYHPSTHNLSFQHPETQPQPPPYNVDQSQNPLLKKCFERERSIKSVKQLQGMFQTQILSKTKYKPGREKQSNLNSSVDSFRSEFSTKYPKKKNIVDKLPRNIFAADYSVDRNLKKDVSVSRNIGLKYSESKRIKNSIIKY